MDIITKLDFLKEVDLFSDLQEEKLVNLARILTEKKISKHHFIYNTGDACDEMYFLSDGTIKIGKHSHDGKEVIKSIIHPKVIFGEAGVLGLNEYDNFAKAIDTNVKYFALKVSDFKAFLEENPDLYWKMINSLGSKLRHTERRFESLVFKDARERIIDFLKDNAKNFGRQVGLEMLIKHSLTQQDIANFTGTSRQTVTSVLNDLKKSNQIYFKRKSILIRDMTSLS